MTEANSQRVKSTRAHETRVVIDAPMEDVWKALTEPAAIARWFAPKMTVEPGVGGSVLADWGPGLEWMTTIEVGEPNRHLRLAETRERVMTASPDAQALEPCRLVQDYYLEAEGGKTVLRLVHSGFGTSEGWDIEYEGTRGGWAVCFLRLKHALELHRNHSAHNFIVLRLCPGVDKEEALARMESAVPVPSEFLFRGDYQFCVLLPEHHGSIFSSSIQPCTGGSVTHVEFLLFGLSDAEARAMENQWNEKLAQLFPAAG